MYQATIAWDYDFHITFQWRHNERDGVSNHQPHGCLFNHLFKHRWKKTSKLPVTGLCTGNSPVTGEFPAQKASNAENVSSWIFLCGGGLHHLIELDLANLCVFSQHSWRLHSYCKFSITGSDNGLSSVWHQAIIWTILTFVNWTLLNKFQWNCNKYAHIFSKKYASNMLSANWLPFYQCLNVSIDLIHKSHNAPFLYPIMHHFVTEMCTCVRITVTKLYIFVFLSDASCDFNLLTHLT